MAGIVERKSQMPLQYRLGYVETYPFTTQLLAAIRSYLKIALIVLCPLLLLFLYLAAPPPQPHLQPHQPVPHSVGFSLSLDYATTSIYFPNGTTVDVAKIEGSQAYKSFMRGVHTPGGGEVYEWGYKEGILVQMPFDGGFLRLPVPNFVRREWVRRQIGADTHVCAVKDMVEALKGATERYLGEKVEVADIAVPVSPSDSGRYVLSNAVKLAGIKGNGRIVTAGTVATMANQIGLSGLPTESSCGDDGRLVLTLDYSRAALTAALYEEENCVLDMLRGRHDIELGTDALTICMQQSDDEERCYLSLKHELTEIVKMPVEDGTEETPYWPGVPDVPELPTEMGVVVLLGEKGDDPVLRKVLREVLMEQGTDLLALNKDAYGERRIVDPTFAAARGMATATWIRQNDGWFCTCPV